MMIKRIIKRLRDKHKREGTVVATSDLTFYEDGVKKLGDMGTFIGVMAHEMAHNIDDLKPRERKRMIEQIIRKYNINLLPEDYSKWGEKELFADLMALSFYAEMGWDDKIKKYCKIRSLRKGLYEAFQKK